MLCSVPISDPSMSMTVDPEWPVAVAVGGCNAVCCLVVPERGLREEGEVGGVPPDDAADATIDEG